MIRKVVYFSRSGNAKRIAEKIANQLQLECIQILDHKNWNGFFGYMKAGFYSTANKNVKISTSKDVGEYDELIVVTPLWAGSIANATRTFLSMHPREKIHLVVNSIGSTTTDRDGFRSITDIMNRDLDEDDKIHELISLLK